MENDQTLNVLRIVGAGSAIAFLNEMIRRLNPEGMDRYSKGGHGTKFITFINPWKKDVYCVPLRRLDSEQVDFGSMFDDRGIIFDELTLCQLRSFGRLLQNDHQAIVIHGNGKPQIYADKPRPQSEMPEFPDYVYDSFLAWSVVANVFGYQESPCLTNVFLEQNITSVRFKAGALAFETQLDAIWVMTVSTSPNGSDEGTILSIVHRESLQHYTNGFYHSL